MNNELKLNDEYEVTILKQDHFGRGIAKVNNILVFVPHGVAGDICNIKITTVKKKFAIGIIKEILVPSKDRVEVICPYYDDCGGCQIMEINSSKKIAFKEFKVKELLEKFGGLKDINIFPIISKNELYYRNKVIFHGDGKKLGFYQEATHSVVDINKCMITNKKINELYEKILVFLDNNLDCNIDFLMIRTTSLNEIMVSVSGNINNDKFLSCLNKDVVVYINNQLVQGKSYIVEDIFGIKFKIYPDSFFQINYDAMLELYSIVIKYYQDKDYDKVLDLYCGTGTLGMLISPYVKNVVGVDVEKSSIVSANECKVINNINNINFIEGKVENKIDSFKDVDSIIVDPPRSGLDLHSIQTILQLSPKSIVYISCDPVTLVRDLKILLTDYMVLEIHPVDMFPNTYHVETVTILEKI